MRILIPLVALSLCSCTSFATPERCEQAAAGLNTAAQIAAVLVNRGIDPAKAQKFAEAIVTGQMLLAVACAQASP